MPELTYRNGTTGNYDDECIWLESRLDDGSDRWALAFVMVNPRHIRLQVSDDAWMAFTEHPDLFAALGRLGDDPTDDDIRRVLRDHGATEQSL